MTQWAGAAVVVVDVVDGNWSDVTSGGDDDGDDGEQRICGVSDAAVVANRAKEAAEGEEVAANVDHWYYFATLHMICTSWQLIPELRLM